MLRMHLQGVFTGSLVINAVLATTLF